MDKNLANWYLNQKLKHRKMKKMEEILNGQVGGNLTKGEGKNTYEMEKWPNSPFHIVSYEDHSHITMGRFRLTDGQLTKEQCQQILETPDWNFIMNFTITLMEGVKMMNKKDLWETIQEQTKEEQDNIQ